MLPNLRFKGLVPAIMQACIRNCDQESSAEMKMLIVRTIFVIQDSDDAEEIATNFALKIIRDKTISSTERALTTHLFTYHFKKIEGFLELVKDPDEKIREGAYAVLGNLSTSIHTSKMGLPLEFFEKAYEKETSEMVKDRLLSCIIHKKMSNELEKD